MNDRFMIHTIHGGDVIPPEYHSSLHSIYPENKVHSMLYQYNALEKDWGCNQIAQKLAEYLNIGGFWRVNTARVLFDFGRFPGITRPGADHLDRYAINYPFSYALDYPHKKSLLEDHYDFISNTYEKANVGKQFKIAIHTYDPYNPSTRHYELGTPRPELSVVFRSESYQKYHHMPYGLFDPLYPDSLAELTADRKLMARISLNMEKAGYSLSHNFPYYLPDGSVEVRSQIWFFFKYLKRVFEREFPDTTDNPAYDLVWRMLMDTNLRNSSSEALRSFIHMYRKAPLGMDAFFEDARCDYDRIREFLKKNRDDIIANFRLSTYRVNTFGIEVRKDLIWRFQDDEARQPVLGPEGAKHENIERIAENLANAMQDYLKNDCAMEYRLED